MNTEPVQKQLEESFIKFMNACEFYEEGDSAEWLSVDVGEDHASN